MDLSTTYMGIELPNPLVGGPSPISDHVDASRRLEDAGASALVMHSLFMEQILREQQALADLDAHSHSPQAPTSPGPTPAPHRSSPGTLPTPANTPPTEPHTAPTSSGTPPSNRNPRPSQIGPGPYQALRRPAKIPFGRGGGTSFCFLSRVTASPGSHLPAHSRWTGSGWSGKRFPGEVSTLH